MPISRIRCLIPILALSLGGTLAWAHQGGPIPSRTGAPATGGKPAENTCNIRGCHVGNPLNQNGTLKILGMPTEYVALETYALTVRLESEATTSNSNRKWGFQLTAIDAEGNGVGVFHPGDLGMMDGAGQFAGREYVTHNIDNIFQGEQSPAQWTVSWTAPDAGGGAVSFYAAGNAANGNNNSSNDFIYTGSATAGEAMSPVQPTTWGAIKQAHGTRSPRLSQ